jgi:hypothetical protein
VPTYFIRPGGHGQQGPFEEGRIQGWVAEGKVRAGMQISADGERWTPVERHPLFARAPATASAQPEPVEAIEEVPADRPRRSRRTPARPAPRSASGANAAAAVIGLLVMGGIGYAVMGGSTGADHSVGGTAGAPATTTPSVEQPKPSPVRETKEAFRARWARFHDRDSAGRYPPENTVRVGPHPGWIDITDEPALKLKIVEICGREPERTQTVGERRYWYFPCSDGAVQLIWWRWNAAFEYQINDY